MKSCIWLMLSLVILISGCNEVKESSGQDVGDIKPGKQVSKPEETVEERATKEEGEFSQLAFDILKNDDVAAIPKITLEFEDYIILEEGFAKNKQPVPSKEKILAIAEKSYAYQKKKAADSLGKVRKEIEDLDFDWSNAKLDSVKQKQGDKEYDVNSTERNLDIILVIKSGEKTIHVRLGDCIYSQGRRRTADGYRPFVKLIDQ